MIARVRFRTRHRAANGSVLLLIIASIGSRAQTAVPKNNGTTSSLTIQASVREVLIPVVVIDKKGHYITDLKLSDFRVYEDGTPQKIVAFSSAPDTMILRPDGTTVTHVEPALLPGFEQKTVNTIPRRTYLVCVDTLHSSFANFVRVRQALQKFFEQEHGGDSQYALMALGRELTVVRDSTRNPAEILAAIEDKHFLKTIQDSEASGMGMEIQQFTGAVSRYCQLCGCGAGEASSQLLGCAGAREQVRSSLMRYSSRALVLNQRFLRGLDKVVAAMVSMPTIRTVILISDGFNRQPGNELYAILRAYTPGKRDFEFNPFDTDTQGVLNGIIRIATTNNVRFYTIDSRGLYTLASLPGSGWDASSGGVPSDAVDRAELNIARQNTDGLAELARATGGLFFEKNNNLLKGIQRAFADGREHYVLAYVPSNKALDGTYRKIQVEVKRDKVSVSAKPGYWAPKK